jgi:pyruvate/2-oxoglutarate dehydrogenase complex dihydrolipoamide acyltransferase (E2) component
MEKESKYTIKKFPSSRQSTFDAGYVGIRKNRIKGLIELDVTLGREALKMLRREKKIPLSFTAWIIKCISQAISENKEVHAVRKGKSRLVIFDDIDVSVIVEKDINGEKVPLPLVIRKTNEKTVQDIHLEIKAAQEQEVKSEEDYLLGKNGFKWAMKLYISLPGFIRRFVMSYMFRQPFLIKNMSGTVAVTAVGMMGNVKGWPIPSSVVPACFALGSVVKKPGVVDGEIEIRDYLYMTILLDHDAIDGAPAARFVSRLSKLIESAWGLEALC